MLLSYTGFTVYQVNTSSYLELWFVYYFVDLRLGTEQLWSGGVWNYNKSANAS